MKDIRIKLLMLFASMSLAQAVCAIAVSKAEMPQPILLPRIYVDFPYVIMPSKTEVKVGEDFEAYIKIEGVESLYGVEFHLYWETAKVCYIYHEVYSPWTPYLIVRNEISHNATHEWFWLAIAAGAPSPPFSGNSTIAKINFRCRGPGETVLDLQNTHLIDYYDKEIPHYIYDGTVFQVAPLTVSISPSSAAIILSESVIFTSNVVGGKPPFTYRWYLNGEPVPEATEESWIFKPTTTGNFTVYLIVQDSMLNTAKSNEAEVRVASKLFVSISPTEATTLIGHPITFTSTVSGGYPPYTYQWYLNGNPVSEAISDTLTFTPTASGIYYVYLKITDTKGYTAQSNMSRVVVATVPVGGYSISIQNPIKIWLFTIYIVLLLALTIVNTKLGTRRRKIVTIN